MSIFLLLLGTPDEPQTYSLAFKNKYHQLVCTLSTTSPTTHLIDQVLMRGHPPVPLWSVWRSCSRAVLEPQEDETEEAEGSANPCWAGSQRSQSGPTVHLAWKLGHHRWDCPAQSWRWQHTPHRWVTPLWPLSRHLAQAGLLKPGSLNQYVDSNQKNYATQKNPY